MKKTKKIKWACFLAVIATLQGCAIGKSKWTGLVPGKDFEADRFKHTITTPWGGSVLEAEGVKSYVNPQGKREHWLPPDSSAPGSTNQAVIITPSLTVRPQ